MRKFSLCPEHYDKLSSSDKTKIKLEKFLESTWKIWRWAWLLLMLVPAYLFYGWTVEHMNTFIMLAILSVVLALTTFAILNLIMRKLRKDVQSIFEKLKDDY